MRDQELCDSRGGSQSLNGLCGRKAALNSNKASWLFNEYSGIVLFVRFSPFSHCVSTGGGGRAKVGGWEGGRGA